MGHGGFWGTKALYLPDLNTTVSIAVLERGHRATQKAVIDQMVGLLMR